MSLKRIISLLFIAGTVTVMSCRSNNSNKNTGDTATSVMGADTTSAATDSLRDSLNR